MCAIIAGQKYNQHSFKVDSMKGSKVTITHLVLQAFILMDEVKYIRDMEIEEIAERLINKYNEIKGS